MRKGSLSDRMQQMNYTELRRPSLNISHELHNISLDKTIFQGVKPARGASAIKTTGTGKYDMNNLNLLTALDYRGGLEAYNKEVSNKKQHRPIVDKKIPNCSDRIERMLLDMSNGSDETFESLVDLLQLKTGLSKQRYQFDDCDILEALNKAYRKSPEQLMIVEEAYKNA